MASGICLDCGVEKDLTVHGTCWKCHVGGIQTSSKCKNCGKIEDYRTSQKITTKVTVTPTDN